MLSLGYVAANQVTAGLSAKSPSTGGPRLVEPVTRDY